MRLAVRTTGEPLLLAAPIQRILQTLTAIGLYGVLAYHVSQRTNEIGIRLAMGASTTKLLGMILRKAWSWRLEWRRQVRSEPTSCARS